MRTREENDALLRRIWEIDAAARAAMAENPDEAAEARAVLDGIAEKVEAAPALAGTYLAMRSAAPRGVDTAFDERSGYMVAYSPFALRDAVWADVEAGRVVSREAAPMELVERVFRASSERGRVLVNHARIGLDGLGPFDGPRDFDVGAFAASFLFVEACDEDLLGFDW